MNELLRWAPVEFARRKSRAPGVLVERARNRALSVARVRRRRAQDEAPEDRSEIGPNEYLDDVSMAVSIGP